MQVPVASIASLGVLRTLLRLIVAKIQILRVLLSVAVRSRVAEIGCLVFIEVSFG